MIHLPTLKGDFIAGNQLGPPLQIVSTFRGEGAGGMRGAAQARIGRKVIFRLTESLRERIIFTSRAPLHSGSERALLGNGENDRHSAEAAMKPPA